MADNGFTADFSEVERLVVTIARAEAAGVAAVRPVVAKGALNIKNDTRKNISHNPSWKHLASTVNYQMSGNAFFSEAIVGYDDVGQGELAGIYEFGSARRDPHPTLYPAAEREAPNFEKALALVIGKAVEGAL